ncbi:MULTISPECIES: hypothetical protein [unclassified Streptomyces]|uniref:hypothetical protein n=1 Tax=unclassified Streptomyces TaxID=2593676 RepID=UPI0020360BBB|nr:MULTISPECIES: hypothetical protein [unclassified Streptomyces]
MPGYPWKGVRFASAWGSKDVLDVVLVRPGLVAEISVDRAIDRGGVFRHPRASSDCAWMSPSTMCRAAGKEHPRQLVDPGRRPV